MRTLQTAHLLHLSSGLWLVDARQPVAAVLDAGTGGLLGLVSWPEVPPPGVGAGRGTVLGDGDSLWVQHDVGGPVARVDITGLAAAGSTGPPSSRLRLAAVGPGEAWCTTPPPEAEFVRTGEAPGDFLGYGQLCRVDVHGVVETVVVGAGVHRLQSTPQGLLVGVAAPTWGSRRYDEGRSEVHRDTRWHRIPWGAQLPAHLGEEFALADRFVPPPVPDLSAIPSGLAHGQGPAAQTDGLDWFADRSPESRSDDLWDLSRVRALDGSGDVVGSWDLTTGSVVAMTAVGARVAVAVARESRRGAERVVDVVALDPRDGSRQDLVAGTTVDVSEHCWPVGARPVDADSSMRRHRDEAAGRADRLRGAGADDVRIAVVGDWPGAVLETTMTLPARPGVRVRLRVPLFDELGRVPGPRYDDALLADSLDAGLLPPAEDAVDGFLDV